MTQKYTCESCDNRVILPNKAAKEISPFEEMGCANKSEHESGAIEVMKEV